MASVMKEFEASSHLFGSNAPFVEELYERYLEDPASVSPEWKAQFDAWQGGAGRRDVAHSPVIASFERLTRTGAAPSTAAAPGPEDQKSLRVVQFIRAHRTLGSRHSELDPLKRMERMPVPELELEYYGLGEADMDREFVPGSWEGANGKPMRLRDIIAMVKKTYCGTIGIEYMYMASSEQKKWIRQRFEGTLSTPKFNQEEKRWI